MTDSEKKALHYISMLSKNGESNELQNDFSSSKVSTSEAKKFISVVSNNSSSTTKKKKNTNGSKKRQKRKSQGKVVINVPEDKKETFSTSKTLDEKFEKFSSLLKNKKKNKKKKYKKNHDIKKSFSKIFDFLLEKLANTTVLCLFCIVLVAIIFICFL